MSNKIIKLNRGDSYEFSVKITQKNSNNPYLLELGRDIVYFAVMLPHQSFENACKNAYPMQVKGYWAEDEDQDISSGNITIKIEPKDTRCLAPGIYYYTVKLLRVIKGGNRAIIDSDELEEVRTVIERTKFIINE